MDEPEPIVTLKDVFVMVTKLVGQQEALHQRNLQADQLHADHEQRLRALERWRYALPASFVVGLGALGAAIGQALGH